MTVFEIFLDDPMKERHEREVVREAKVSKGSANSILRKLDSLGFLTRVMKGRMVFYSLNTSNPMVKQFKVLKNVYVLETLLNLLKQYSRKIMLFGSCSQGTDVMESDIDLLVYSNEEDEVKKIIGNYNRGHRRKIAPIIVDANGYIRLKREDKPLYENIERGILLWETG
jgi:predicted nucleotidyltransferase